MAESAFDDMKRYIGFDSQDAANLRSLAAPMKPYLPTVVDRFYRQILEHSGARQVLDSGEHRLEQLRNALTRWLIELFGGSYDQAYYQSRSRIGRVHALIGLPQRYMVTAMEIVWQELQRACWQAGVPDVEAKLVSVHKLLILELGTMLESYKEGYSAQVQRKERIAFEEKLTRAEHLAEIGQLAASLAHEIKNPLAGISGAVQIIRDAMEPGHQHRKVIDEILAQINRLDAVVKDLLVYARPVPPKPAPGDLNAIVRRLLTMVHDDSSPKQVSFELVCHDEIAPIQADEVKIEQLVINLLLNAAQASPDGGVVHITTSANGDWVTLTVTDHGHGMDETVRRRAFEPFYTTRARGTGLGLPICKRIVEAHAGTIALSSVIGVETVVTVLLPRAKQQEQSDAP